VLHSWHNLLPPTLAPKEEFFTPVLDDDWPYELLPAGFLEGGAGYLV